MGKKCETCTLYDLDREVCTYKGVCVDFVCWTNIEFDQRKEEKSCINCKWHKGKCTHPYGQNYCGGSYKSWELKKGSVEEHLSKPTPEERKKMEEKVEPEITCDNCFWGRGTSPSECTSQEECMNFSQWKPIEEEKVVCSILEHQHVERDLSPEEKEFIKEAVKPVEDNVNHPTHYTQGKIEVIEVIEDWKLNYIEGNIIKYVARYKHKNGKEDLEKARFYLNRLIVGLDK